MFLNIINSLAKVFCSMEDNLKGKRMVSVENKFVNISEKKNGKSKIKLQNSREKASPMQFEIIAKTSDKTLIVRIVDPKTGRTLTRHRRSAIFPDKLKFENAKNDPDQLFIIKQKEGYYKLYLKEKDSLCVTANGEKIGLKSCKLSTFSDDTHVNIFPAPEKTEETNQNTDENSQSSASSSSSEEENKQVVDVNNPHNDNCYPKQNNCGNINGNNFKPINNCHDKLQNPNNLPNPVNHERNFNRFPPRC